MSQKHPIEALLRPPVELYSAGVACTAAVVACLAPSAVMMTPPVAWATAAVLGSFALIRLRDGLMILRYQRGMRRLPTYVLTADKIPLSRHRLFLGRGFRWQQRHTQRLRDTLVTANERYVCPSWRYEWARRMESRWEHSPLLQPVTRWMRADHWLNPVRPLPPVGGNPCLHAVELNEQDVHLPLGERVGHTLVLGTTRVGKTRLCEILVAQDIRRGDVVIVFDPKGDAELLRRMYAEARRCGRDQEFYVFHLGRPDISSRYNALGSFSRITEVATRATQPLPGDGGSAAFKAFAWRFANIVSSALVTLGQRPTFDLLLRYVTNIESLFVDYALHLFKKPELKALLQEHAPKEHGGALWTWEQLLVQEEGKINEKNTPLNMKSRQKRSIALVNLIKAYRIFDPVLDGLRGAVEYDKTYFDKITASFLPFLEKLTSGRAGELISPDYFDVNDPRPIFDWMQIIRKKGIVYIGLDAMTDMEVSSAVGNSMFADLVSVSGYIYKFGTTDGLGDGHAGEKPVISLHADEFNELMGNEFIPLVNKAGGSGVQVTAYTQTLSDIEARIGNRAKAGQVIGNFNTLIMLRVREEATAMLLSTQLPKVEVNTLMLVSGVNDSSDTSSGVDFTSANQDRVASLMVPMLEPSDLIRLPKGQAFALMEGGQLWKLRMPLPSSKNDPLMPPNLESLAADMERDYRTGETWWLGSSMAVAADNGSYSHDH